MSARYDTRDAELIRKVFGGNVVKGIDANNRTVRFTITTGDADELIENDYVRQTYLGA